MEAVLIWNNLGWNRPPKVIYFHLWPNAELPSLLDQGAQGYIKFWNLQGWKNIASLTSLLQCYVTLMVMYFVLTSTRIFPSCNFSVCPSEESGSMLKYPLLSLNSGGLQKDTSLSFSIQSKVTLLCQPPLMHHMLFPHNHPLGLLLDSFQYISVSLVPGIPTLDTILQKQCCKNWMEGNCFDLLTSYLLI